MKNFILYAFIFIICSCSSGNEEVIGETASFDILAVKVTNLNNEPPKKGEEITIKITVRNTGSNKGTATITPKLSSSKYSDYKNVTLPFAETTLEGGETADVNIKIGPFFKDQAKEKHYALGHGEYFFESLLINDNNIDKIFSGKVFNIEPSTVLLVPVIYNEQYLSKLNYPSGIKEYLRSGFTRRVELYENGNYTEYIGGFDAMMDVKHLFYPIMTVNVSEYNLDEGLCEKATALAGETLGLQGSWKGPEGTQPSNHGFDYLMALSPDSFGGVACGWINVQVSGLFDFDLSVDRSQIVMIHETSHLFGSPHCDPLQSYVMCSGEKHRRYIDQGIYVYHINSRNAMNNRWN